VTSDQYEKLTELFDKTYFQWTEVQYRIYGKPFKEDGQSWVRITVGSKVFNWLRDITLSESEIRFLTNSKQILVTERVFVLLTLRWI